MHSLPCYDWHTCSLLFVFSDVVICVYEEQMAGFFFFSYLLYFFLVSLNVAAGSSEVGNKRHGNRL